MYVRVPQKSHLLLAFYFWSVCAIQGSMSGMEVFCLPPFKRVKLVTKAVGLTGKYDLLCLREHLKMNIAGGRAAIRGVQAPPFFYFIFSFDPPHL